MRKKLNKNQIKTLNEIFILDIWVRFLKYEKYGLKI